MNDNIPNNTLVTILSFKIIYKLLKLLNFDVKLTWQKMDGKVYCFC